MTKSQDCFFFETQRISDFPMQPYTCRLYFYPRDDMLARYLLSSCVRPSVYLSVTSRNCNTVTVQRLNAGWRIQRHTIAQGL